VEPRKNSENSEKADITHLKNSSEWLNWGNHQKCDVWLLKLDKGEYLITGAGHIVKHK